MANVCYHPSIEGAQHGAKSLPEFLDYAKRAGATGAQPSNYMLQGGKLFKGAKEVREAFDSRGMTLDGISAHCPFWVHTSAWTGTKSGHPFIPPEAQALTPEKLEKWTENYLLKLMDLAAELKIPVMPMFWGVAFGWELATGYPWGFWKGPGYDLIEAGKERFEKKTSKLRKAANERGLKLCHEIHPGTAAMCAADFHMLVESCDGDPCLGVNADPSHCWENEGSDARFLSVASRIYAAHVKNHTIRPGVPLRAMEPEWSKRGMQFTDLPSGDLNLARYVEMLISVGYPQRYCQLMGTSTAPLVVEAESAYRDIDSTSANGIAYVRDTLCFPVASGSFEDGMGA